MFGTESFILVQNLVEDIKILNLRPFAAICDLCEAPLSQKDVKKLIGIKVLIQDIYKKTDYRVRKLIQSAQSLFKNEPKNVLKTLSSLFGYH